MALCPSLLSKLCHVSPAGMLVSVGVSPGSKVDVGDDLCTVEAMKMRNVIKAEFSGEVGEVLVAAGQVVQADQALVKFK